MKKYAIWHEGEVIGYCEMEQETAWCLNSLVGKTAGVYLGFDKTIAPEKYERPTSGEQRMTELEKRVTALEQQITLLTDKEVSAEEVAKLVNKKLAELAAKR